ncbi:SAM-dependent methyltransferase [bacterium]|nr:SAM-dependent methyltransferase [bacterium]
MIQDQASRTAQYMAFFRALETARASEFRLFEDRFAKSFLSPRLKFISELCKIPIINQLLWTFVDYRWPGALTSAIARTRFIDDEVKLELKSGARQLIILGAGYDTRAYRIHDPAKAMVYEVDHPSTSATKQKIMGSNHVRFVPVDFNSESLESKMKAAGYDSALRSVLIWEGVTNYLTESAVDATLRWCSQAASGSVVIFTYVDERVLKSPENFYGTKTLFEALKKAGEEWTFGIDPSCISDFLSQRGLLLTKDLGAAEYRQIYFGRAANQMRGYEFYRIAVARVK